MTAASTASRKRTATPPVAMRPARSIAGANAPIITALAPSPLDLIDANIGPLMAEPDLIPVVRLRTVAAVHSATDAAAICRLADLARSYDKIAALVNQDYSGAAEVGPQVEEALIDRLAEIREEATGPVAKSAAGAAFAILVAYSQLDLTTNGINEDVKQDAKVQVEKLLYAVRDYFAAEFDGMPEAVEYSMPDRCDPRKAAS